MNIVDIIILIFFVLCLLDGWKKGVVKGVVTLLGTILIFILAFYLKTPLSIFMYEHFPFFSLNGIFENVTVMNILIYEGLSFLLTFSILAIILKVVGKVTGIVDSILSKLILLGLPSKILGAVVGVVQGYLILFVILFCISTFAKPSIFIEESKLSNAVMTNTPILSGIVEKPVNVVKEVYDICINTKDKENANLESLDVLMKYEVLSYESANKLLESGKLKLNNAESVIKKYRSEVNG